MKCTESKCSKTLKTRFSKTLKIRFSRVPKTLKNMFFKVPQNKKNGNLKTCFGDSLLLFLQPEKHKHLLKNKIYTCCWMFGGRQHEKHVVIRLFVFSAVKKKNKSKHQVSRKQVFYNFLRPRK